MSPADAFHWSAGLALRHKVLSFAIGVVLVELVLRRFAPKSRAYARWSRFFVGLGSVWTAVILSIVYVLSVGPSASRCGSWARTARPHAGARALALARARPNPLGRERAARHQF